MTNNFLKHSCESAYHKISRGKNNTSTGGPSYGHLKMIWQTYHSTLLLLLLLCGEIQRHQANFNQISLLKLSNRSNPIARNPPGDYHFIPKSHRTINQHDSGQHSLLFTQALHLPSYHKMVIGVLDQLPWDLVALLAAFLAGRFFI